MLSVLRVAGLAIIDRVELEFAEGLNVVTGETGAGKSILIAALELVLGGRGRAGIVRTGCERAEIEALFDVQGRDALRAMLAELDLDSGPELVIRRVLQPSGRTRAYVNGRLTTLEQLRRIATGLVDISSQHEYHRLADPAGHIEYLDAFGDLGASRAVVAEAWGAARDARRALDAALAGVRDRAEREDLLRFQLAEVREIAPMAGELDALEQQISRLSHADRLERAAAGAESALYGRDRSITEQLSRVLGGLQEGVVLDPSLGPLAERLDGAITEVEEVARDLADYAARIQADPQELERSRARVRRLERLVRRHGAGLQDVLDWQDNAETELATLEQGEAHIDELKADAEAKLQEALVAAEALSLARHGAASALSVSITAELSELGMGDAQVVVEVAPSGGPGGLECAGRFIGSAGMDRVQFLIAPNPGEEPRPLAQIASGGELSRSLLALKRVLAHLGDVGLYVFDEIDTGVGGAIAEVIGRKLADVAAGGNQVICITHSPQVAVYADEHHHVCKCVEGGRTFSIVRQLTLDERTEELARMLGGIDVGGGSRAAAAELLHSAERSRVQGAGS